MVSRDMIIDVIMWKIFISTELSINIILNQV